METNQRTHHSNLNLSVCLLGSTSLLTDDSRVRLGARQGWVDFYYIVAMKCFSTFCLPCLHLFLPMQLGRTLQHLCFCDTPPPTFLPHYSFSLPSALSSFPKLIAQRSLNEKHSCYNSSPLPCTQSSLLLRLL